MSAFEALILWFYLRREQRHHSQNLDILVSCLLYERCQLDNISPEFHSKTMARVLAEFYFSSAQIADSHRSGDMFP